MAGFTQRWLDHDWFAAKASEVYTVHEMEAAAQSGEKNGTNRHLAFEKGYRDDDGEGIVTPRPHWASQLEVWGNYELGDGDMVHGRLIDELWSSSKPDFEARVHEDGICGDNALITSANKPRGN